MVYTDLSILVVITIYTYYGIYHCMYQQIIAEQRRQIRGMTIISIANQIKRINKFHYQVKSQTGEKK